VGVKDTRSAVRLLQERAVTEGWDAWRLVEAISAECGTSLLTAHRMARGWTLQEAVTRMAELAPAPGKARPGAVSVQMLNSWERQRVTPTLANADLLCRLYETRVDRLGLAAAGFGPAGNGRPTPPATTAPLEEVVALGAETRGRFDRMLRRSLVPPDLAGWERRVDAHAREGYLTWVSTLPAMAEDFVAVRGMLAPGQPEPYYRRGCRVLAQLGGLIGIGLMELGENTEALAWYRIGEGLAERAGEVGLRAWVHSCHAGLLTWEKDPVAATAQARQALALVGARPGVGGLTAMSTLALALARQGRHDEAARALTATEQRFARWGDHLEPDTVASYTELYLCWTQGMVFGAAGDLRRARRSLERGKELVVNPVISSMLGIEQAACLVREGDVPHACAHALEELRPLSVDERGGIVRAGLDHLLDTVPRRARSQECVRELRSAADAARPTRRHPRRP
jgi:hypothetical protein